MKTCKQMKDEVPLRVKIITFILAVIVINVGAAGLYYVGTIRNPEIWEFLLGTNVFLFSILFIVSGIFVAIIILKDIFGLEGD